MTEAHMCPVMRPAHNLREISKQLVLLEDHLFHECKRCKDCIRKHLLTAEALAEETVSLDKNQSVKGSQSIAPTIRGVSAARKFWRGHGSRRAGRSKAPQGIGGMLLRTGSGWTR